MPAESTALLTTSTSFVGFLSTRALYQPHQAAYTFLLDGEIDTVQLTYAALDRRARAIAAQLLCYAAPGDRVLLLYPPGLEYIAAFFGCLYAEAVAVPAYPPDPARLDRTLPRLQAIMQDARPQVLLTTAAIAGFASALTAYDPAFGETHWLVTDTLADNLAEEWRAPAVSQATLALLQYTSGSTAAPKGVMLTHGNLLHNSELIHASFAHSPACQGVIWLPPYHDMGLIGGILQPLYGGFPVVLISPIAFLQRPLRWLQAITRYHATTSGGPNFAYDLCVRKTTLEQRAALDLSSWTVAFNGAEPIHPETLSRFAAAFAECGFRKEAFLPCYGLAEATLIVAGGRVCEPPITRAFERVSLSHNRAVEVADSSGEDVQRLVGCGQLQPDQQLLIVDPAAGERCEVGQVGEVWLASPSVAQGYWGRPEETAQTFCPALADDVGPFLRTGDLGFVYDDELFIAGRIKDLIIIRGRNHYPQDIERTMQQSTPVARPGCGAAFEITVAGEERLVVVQEVGRAVTALDSVIDAIRRSVAEQHELQIYSVCLLRAGSIPKTSSGKVQRYACRDGFLDGNLEVVYHSTLELAALAVSDSELTRDALLGMEPGARQTRLSDELRVQVAQVLHLEPAQLALQQPLTALGVDSLQAVELQHRLEEHLGVTLPLAAFLDGLSVAQLATRVLNTLADAHPIAGGLTRAPALAPAPRQQYMPLSSAQRRLWFMDQLAPGRSAYSIPVTVRLSGPLNARALDQSVSAIIERHEILRTTFHKVQSQPVQVVHPARPLRLARADLSALPEPERSAYLAALIAELVALPFDLACGPLLRMELLRLNEDAHVLVLTLHHIIADGWSMGIFLGELTTLYAAFVSGEQRELPPLPVQYADFAYVQQEWFQAGGLSDQPAYWQGSLADAPRALELPTDYPRPAAPTLRGAHRFFLIGHDTCTALEAFSCEQGTTLYMTLLSAFLILLHSYTERDDMIVGTDLASRHWAGTENLIGLFVNQLVLRVDLSGNPSAQEVLRRVRGVTLDAYAHPDVPFDKLVEVLKPARDPSRNPLFQVMFVLENAPLPPLELPGLRLELLEVDSGGAPFDLSLLLSQMPDGLRGELRYSTDLFKETTIARIADQFHMLLNAIIEQPQASLSDLISLLAAADRRRQAAQAEALQISRLKRFEQMKQKRNR